MFLSFFLSTTQSTRSTLTKMAEAERSFEERFSETVRQCSVIYDNDSFSLDKRSFRLHLFLHLFLFRQ